MAKTEAVWGIDIGQSALKAILLKPGPDPSQVIAESFDFIEYPKILSQADADPVELVQAALKEFLGRNSVKGIRVAISVPGQSGLARFIKLPPVEVKQIPAIVKFEAKQQIPFALEDVVWDFQLMSGGNVYEGFAMETEVGIFAMKRDQVLRQLRPFTDAGIEVDIIQLAPLALYNMIAFDQLQEQTNSTEYDADNPPPSLMLLSLGTDTTDLVITNGFRVWNRSIPVGGNHFTKALTKELKLTFASAEHIKRNSSQSDDPKALFQAMRPVFSDLLQEVQRSMNYFTNLDRKAKITKAVAVGNSMKLPGLNRYIAQNLGLDLQRTDSFRGLIGKVVEEPVFKDNALAFAVAYGLALQGLKNSKINTNLLPKEQLVERLIRAKKPWAVAAVASMMVAVTLSLLSLSRANDSVSTAETYFGAPLKKAEALQKKVTDYKNSNDKAKTAFEATDQIGKSLLMNSEGKELWLEVLKAVNLAVPRDDGDRPGIENLGARNEIIIESFESARVDDLKAWYNAIKPHLDKPTTTAAAAAPAVTEDGAATAPNPAAPAPNAAAPAPNPAAPAANPAANPAAPATTPTPGADPAAPAEEEGPLGAGWVFELRCRHFHNSRQDLNNSGMQYVRNTILKNLRLDELPIPVDQRIDGGPTMYPIKKLGLGYPVAIEEGKINWENKLSITDPKNPDKTKDIDAPVYVFRLQFCWQEKPPSSRPAGEFGSAPLQAPPAAAGAAQQGNQNPGNSNPQGASNAAQANTNGNAPPPPGNGNNTPPDANAGNSAAGNNAAGNNAAGNNTPAANGNNAQPAANGNPPPQPGVNPPNQTPPAEDDG